MVATIGAGAARDLAQNPSEASTSADNTIFYEPPQIVDNGDPAFRTVGRWTAVAGQGFQSDLRWIKKGNGKSTATWTFNDLTPGQYRVATTWTTSSKRATNAPFTVYDGAFLVGSRSMNQKTPPNDAFAQGAAWENLGTFNVFTGSLIVKLSDKANGEVVADAVRIERVGDLVVPPVQIVDNGDARYSTRGTWATAKNLGYQGDQASTAKGSGSSYATWTFLVEPGMYRFDASWSRSSKWATNAPFTISDGSTMLDTVAVNQELSPNDLRDRSRDWESLGRFALTGPVVTVKLTNKANDFVVADAIRLERLPDGPEIQLFDGATKLADGAAIDFGSTFVGIPATKTIEVKNLGNRPLALTPLAGQALPAGFELVSDLGTADLARAQRHRSCCG